jgi:hypothetical protein
VLSSAVIEAKGDEAEWQDEQFMLRIDGTERNIRMELIDSCTFTPDKTLGWVRYPMHMLKSALGSSKHRLGSGKGGEKTAGMLDLTLELEEA